MKDGIEITVSGVRVVFTLVALELLENLSLVLYGLVLQKH